MTSAAAPIASNISGSATQFANFVSRNWYAFQNSTIQYGKLVLKSPVAQKITAFAQAIFAKIGAVFPQLNAINWTTGNCVIAACGTLFIALYIIGMIASYYEKN